MIAFLFWSALIIISALFIGLCAIYHYKSEKEIKEMHDRHNKPYGQYE